MPKRVALVATDFPQLEKHCPNWFGMKKGLKKLGIEYRFISCRPDLEIDEISRFRPDLIVYGLLDIIKNEEWRMRIKDENPQAQIVMWYGDLRDDKTGQVRADCSELDALFISNNAQEDFYKEMWKVNKVHFLPLGCEPIGRPLYDPHFSFPFVFIGGKFTAFHFIDRTLEINKLENEGLQVINSFTNGLRAKIFEKMPTIYSSSKISLDMSHFTNVLGYTSIRYWEIPAFYGFPLTKRFPGCEEFYKDRVYFDTLEECVDLKNYYLKHEDERLKIVESLHRQSYNHTYKERFTEMFKLL